MYLTWVTRYRHLPQRRHTRSVTSTGASPNHAWRTESKAFKKLTGAVTQAAVDVIRLQYLQKQRPPSCAPGIAAAALPPTAVKLVCTPANSLFQKQRGYLNFGHKVRRRNTITPLPTLDTSEQMWRSMKPDVDMNSRYLASHSATGSLSSITPHRRILSIDHYHHAPRGSPSGLTSLRGRSRKKNPSFHQSSKNVMTAWESRGPICFVLQPLRLLPSVHLSLASSTTAPQSAAAPVPSSKKTPNVNFGYWLATYRPPSGFALVRLL